MKGGHMAKKAQTKDVAKRSATEVAAADEFDQHAGEGFENVGASDLLVPRLAILQALSPQLKKGKPEFIEGATLGTICDVGTGELFPEGVLFLPVYYRKDYIEWAPRASGKGLVDIHQDPSILDQCTRDEKNKPIMPNGNYIAETAQMFGLNLTADWRKSFIPMASTQLKKSRKWLTLATGEKLERKDGSKFTPPLFYRSYQLGTAEESNAEGDWIGWVVERGMTVPELGAAGIGIDFAELKRVAVEFREALIKGEANVDASQMGDAESAPGGEEAM